MRHELKKKVNKQCKSLNIPRQFRRTGVTKTTNTHTGCVEVNL